MEHLPLPFARLATSQEGIALCSLGHLQAGSTRKNRVGGVDVLDLICLFLRIRVVDFFLGGRFRLLFERVGLLLPNVLR